MRHSLHSVIFVVTVLFSITASAQSPGSFDPSGNITPSAETFSVSKYGKLSPAMYTGAMSYILPVFTYEDPEFTVPISLAYHFDGYRPAEHSGVGDAALDILSVKTAVKRKRVVELLHKCVCFFRKSAAPKLRHICDLLINSALTKMYPGARQFQLPDFICAPAASAGDFCALLPRSPYLFPDPGSRLSGLTSLTVSFPPPVLSLKRHSRSNPAGRDHTPGSAVWNGDSRFFS